MPGYLYRIVTDVVVEEELSENKLKMINRDLRDNLKVLVLDEEVEVVKAEDQNLYPHPIHEHVSTEDESCEFCYAQLAADEQYVDHP